MKESVLLRKSLLGFRISPFDTPPLFRISDWEVFDAGKISLLPPDVRARNLNYQIQRNDKEKILVRIFLTPDKTTILKTNYYIILKNTDEEQSLYLVRSLQQQLGIPLCDDHQLNFFGF